MNRREARLEKRELHLIDIENELGHSRPTASEIARFRTFYLMRNNVPVDAHVVIAASSGPTLLEVAAAWPGARRVFVPGRDGADLALISVALNENVEKRYGHVVIASGDHIFSESARILTSHGVRVAVFSRAAFLSNQLRDSCSDIRVFSARDFALAA